MSVGLIIKVYKAEERARSIISDAEERARKIIDNAYSRKNLILSLENIEKLKQQYIESYKQELSEEISIPSSIAEEMERLNTIKQEELEEIADEILKVIFQ